MEGALVLATLTRSLEQVECSTLRMVAPRRVRISGVKSSGVCELGDSKLETMKKNIDLMGVEGA